MSEVIDAANPQTAADPAESLVQLTHVSYALYALGLLSAGIIAIAGLIIAYLKLDDARGSYIEPHLRFQIRTFWWALGWSALVWLFVLLTLGLGLFVAWIPFGILWIWFAYRIIKGWLKLVEKRAV